MLRAMRTGAGRWMCAATAVSLFVAGCGGEKKADPKAGGAASSTTDPTKSTTPEAGSTTKTVEGTGTKTPESTPAGGTPKVAALSATDPLSVAPKEAFVFALLRPQRIINSSLVKSLPAKFRDDAIKNMEGDLLLPVEIAKVEFLSLAVLPPVAAADGKGPPDRPALMMIRYAEKFDVPALIEAAKANPGTEISEQTANGRKYWRTVNMRPDYSAPPSEDPNAEPKMKESGRFATFLLDDMTLLSGTEATVLKHIEGASSGDIHSRLKGISTDQDLIVTAFPSADKATVGMAALGAGRNLSDEQGEKLMNAIEATKAILVSADLTKGDLLSVTVESTTPDGATKMETEAKDGRSQLEGLYKLFTAQYRQDGGEESMKGLVTYGDKVIEGLTIAKSGNDVTVAIKNPGDLDKLAGLLKPAFEKAEAAAKQVADMNNFKMVGLAIHNYHDVNNSIYRKKEIPGSGLSWRVHLLPYLDQSTLYEQFKQDEPWDSDHNKALIEQMPAVFASELVKEPGKTRIVGFSGEGAPFGREEGLSFRDVKDGLSNTILAVEASPEKAVIWTKPDDLAFDPKDPLTALGKLPGETFITLIMDGSVRKLKATIDPETLKAMITIDGKEEIDETKLE